MASCPCGSGVTYGNCCRPYLRGQLDPPTAEALMRSRYTAYVRRDEDYILRTWHPRTRPPRVELGETAWRGLEILATSHGQPADASGTVTFAAHFMGDAGNIGTMREHSHFELSGDTWLYVDGDVNEKGAA